MGFELHARLRKLMMSADASLDQQIKNLNTRVSLTLCKKNRLDVYLTAIDEYFKSLTLWAEAGKKVNEVDDEVRAALVNKELDPT